MTADHFILDIETCPIKMEGYFGLPEEEQKKLLNPIDSRIVAIGIRVNGKDIIFQEEDEKKMLNDFWWEWKKALSPSFQVVGFNCAHFDIPFLVTRSFIHNVPIVPFTLKSIIDLREKVNAYRYGPSRGTLKEFAKVLGIETDGTDGSDIARLCSEGNREKIKEYLAKDLEITDQMFKRMKETNILNIAKW
ncbi:MAG TPA: ribonuclease H-like domain-containing protein [Candidatus Nanoarchaeia archaeon]|nr:ribonuclease H-like domain-containing protein [Candidatus Nanoarchaeia archaeon]